MSVKYLDVTKLNAAICEAIGVDPSLVANVKIEINHREVTVAASLLIDDSHAESLVKILRAVKWEEVTRCDGCGADFAEFPEMAHSQEDCPGPECTCYELIGGGHQMGCAFYGRSRSINPRPYT